MSDVTPITITATTVIEGHLTLTEEERNIILTLRKEEEMRQQQKELVLVALETAARYARWLEENGRDMSYTTFVDEFGFVDHIGGAPRATYDTVKRCIDAANWW